MASVMYDSAWPTSKEALRLCRLLGTDYADALPPRLWAWGIETDNEKGVFEADAKQLARIVRFDGDCDQLLRAFLSCDVIEETGNQHEFRIRGWKRNARLFKERKRLRRVRKNEKRTRTDTQTPRVQNGSSSSSSLSSSLSKENKEIPRLENDDGGPSKREVRPTRGFPENAFVAEYRDLGAAAGVTVAEPDETERSIVGKLIRRCGAEGITQTQLLAEWWRPEWRVFHGFALRQLDKHFVLVRAAVADPTIRPKVNGGSAAAPKPTRVRAPTADETERKLKAEHEAIQGEKFIDDEEATRRFAEMRRKVGG